MRLKNRSCKTHGGSLQIILRDNLLSCKEYEYECFTAQISFLFSKVRLADQEMIAIDRKDSLLFIAPEEGTCTSHRVTWGSTGSLRGRGKKEQLCMRAFIVISIKRIGKSGEQA